MLLFHGINRKIKPDGELIKTVFSCLFSHFLIAKTDFKALFTNYTNPCDIIASATFTNPPIFAPFT